MPTPLSDSFKASFETLETSEEEDKKQEAADEFARAIEESTAIALAGSLGVNGAAAQPQIEIVFDDSNLAALSATVLSLMEFLENSGFITIG